MAIDNTDTLVELVIYPITNETQQSCIELTTLLHRCISVKIRRVTACAMDVLYTVAKDNTIYTFAKSTFVIPG